DAKITTSVLIYVDDIIITGSNEEHISLVKSVLMAKFKMKDLGPLRYFLGVEVDRQSDGLTLTQHKYTRDILHSTGMTDCKPLNTPSILNHKFSLKEGSPYHDPTLYRRIVGMLQHLTFTRPDIAYAVNQASQFMHAPTGHIDDVKRILRYLKATLGDGLLYTKNSLSSNGHIISTYVDADWAGDPCKKTKIVLCSHSSMCLQPENRERRKERKKRKRGEHGSQEKRERKGRAKKCVPPCLYSIYIEYDV
ncbi:reverse transcriptase domain-containing protein, partial [Klebsiella pneumoniae]|uniref:reverse transcriptase domain-containing protein n=1 Tax=Klebsiella pneumoniae TaxID=573 RepID=UPI003A7FEEA7